MKFYFILTIICLPMLTFANYSLNKNLKKKSPNLVYWSTPLGIERLNQSKYKSDFFALSNHFQPQPNGIVCGPTTGSIVLNALRKGKKDINIPFLKLKDRLKKNLPKNYDPQIRMYSPENFIPKNAEGIKTEAEIFGQKINGKRDFGLQIRQLHKLMIANGAHSLLRVVSSKVPLKKLKAEFLKNLQNPNDFIIINYKRNRLGQTGGGHISPVAAYHEESDSFLVMDVNPNKYPWVWVKATLLRSAMQTFDTKENRGYLLISDSPLSKPAPDG